MLVFHWVFQYYLILSSMSMYGFDQNLKIYLKDNNPRLPCWQSDSWPSPQRCLRQPLLSKSLPVDFGAQKPHPLQLLSHRGPELRAEKSRSAPTWVSGEGLPLLCLQQRKTCWWGYRAYRCICRFTQLLPVLPGVRRPFCWQPTQADLTLLGGAVLPPKAACWFAPAGTGHHGGGRRGTSVTCIGGEGSCLSEAPAKMQKGKPPHLLWKQRARLLFSHWLGARKPVSWMWSCNLNVAQPEDWHRPLNLCLTLKGQFPRP